MKIDWKRIFIYSISSAIIVSVIVFSYGIGTLEERISVAIGVFIIYFLLTFFSEIARKTKPDDPKGITLLNLIVTPPFFKLTHNYKNG